MDRHGLLQNIHAIVWEKESSRQWKRMADNSDGMLIFSMDILGIPTVDQKWTILLFSNQNQYVKDDMFLECHFPTFRVIRNSSG